MCLSPFSSIYSFLQALFRPRPPLFEHGKLVFALVFVLFKLGFTLLFGAFASYEVQRHGKRDCKENEPVKEEIVVLLREEVRDAREYTSCDDIAQNTASDAFHTEKSRKLPMHEPVHAPVIGSGIATKVNSPQNFLASLDIGLLCLEAFF